MNATGWIQPPEESGRDDTIKTILAVVAVNVVGAAPAVLGGPDAAWFESLAKPALFPPTWAFGVVWTLLFTLLGVAVYLVAREGLEERRVKVAVGLCSLQMAVNVAWTPTFFTSQPLAALGVVTVLDVLVVLTIVAFARVERLAASLLVPYLLWILFATVLNYQFWALNA